MGKRSFVLVLFGIVAVGGLAVLPAAGAPLPPGGTFLDDDGSVHEGAIEALVTEGVVDGCAGDPPQSCAGQPTTRGRLASFLVPPASRSAARPSSLPGAPTR